MGGWTLAGWLAFDAIYYSWMFGFAGADDCAASVTCSAHLY
jgi:hypothetical protein